MAFLVRHYYNSNKCNAAAKSSNRQHQVFHRQSSFATVSGHLVWSMPVLVVNIRRMGMGVGDRLMEVHMAVAPRKHQKTTEQHQPPRRPFTEAERYSRTDERCKGEHGASPRRPKSPLR